MNRYVTMFALSCVLLGVAHVVTAYQDPTLTPSSFKDKYGNEVDHHSNVSICYKLFIGSRLKESFDPRRWIRRL